MRFIHYKKWVTQKTLICVMNLTLQMDLVFKDRKVLFNIFVCLL